MKGENWDLVKSIVYKALTLSGNEKNAYLSTACYENPEICAEIEELLNSIEESEKMQFMRPIREDRKELFTQLSNELKEPTSQESIIGKMIRQYRIGEQLGGGGMGVVYKAQDTKLGRTVALKFLPAHLSNDVKAKERFLVEARAAAALDHVNICTIYEIGQTEEEQFFIAMACYEGETLIKKIARGNIPVAKVIDYTLQIANGLSKAHAQGIIHRDIKPANIMITEDEEVKILDFGLAKMSDFSLTKPGTRMGTVAYMSPEQIRGEEIDHRTDCWSLGAVLYELLTGEVPFRGDNEQAILYRIQNQEPKPMRNLRSEVPEALTQVVIKLLQKDPTKRYTDVSALLVALCDRSQEPKSTLAAQAEDTASSGETVPSIAVLPFADMSRGRDQGYFCEGMAEEILNALDRMDGLRVAARTSSFQFKEAGADIQEVGKRLNVGTVLEGSVRKAGNQLRITVKLTNIADGYHRWSERYDRELEDIFAIQDEIAENTVRALQGMLTNKARHILQKMPRTDVRAYDYYLRGRRFFYKQTKRDHEFARQMFARASEVDPTFARAYAGLSDCCILLYKHFGHSLELLEQANMASRKAVELAPELGETHASRGLFNSLSGKDDEAKREFKTAIRLNPRLYEAYFLYAVHEGCIRGNLRRAAQLFEQAAKVQPEDYQAPLLHAAFCRGAGRNERAKTAYRHGLHLARRYLELNPDDARATYLSANAMVALGQKKQGLKWAARALDLDPTRSAFLLYNMAAIYALAGEVERGIDFLEEAVEAGYPQREPVENDPDLQALRIHPRFKALLEDLEPRPDITN